MAEVVCVDGSVLSVLPSPCLGRDGVPYEVTLVLVLDGRPLGEVGERCGWFLARTAELLRAARAESGPEALPGGADDDGRDLELLSLRARVPDDVSSRGELRLWLREDRTWIAPEGAARGHWSLTCRAVLDAWGDGGTGVRAVLDSDGLLALLEALLADCRGVGAAYDGVPSG